MVEVDAIVIGRPPEGERIPTGRSIERRYTSAYRAAAESQVSERPA